MAPRGQPVRVAAPPSDRRERPSTTSSVADGVHRQVMIKSKICHLVNSSVRCSPIPEITPKCHSKVLIMKSGTSTARRYAKHGIC